jgi:hypothetical protein
MVQAKVTDSPHQLTCSQTISYLDYLTSVETTIPTIPLYGIGTYWCMSVWRQVVFASPHSLNLKILCTNKTPVRKHLGIWPAFPIVINYDNYDNTPDDEDDILAALSSEHLDRVCFIGLSVTGSQLGKIAAVMQEPFPALICLAISLQDENAPVLPGGFLGGSAPRLQKILFSGVPYPALPTLLLSASSLVELEL